MPIAKKLTPEIIRAIWDARQRGEDDATIAARHSIGKSTVRYALQRAREAQAALRAQDSVPAEVDEPEVSATPMSNLEIRSMVSASLRKIDRLASTVGDADPAKVASLQNTIARMAPLLARITPDDPTEDPDRVVVSLASLKTEAQRLREDLHRTLDGVLRPVEVPAKEGAQ